MIGNDLLRKGINDYFDIAKEFPEISFHLVGSGNGKIDVENTIINMNLNNVIYHGSLSQPKLSKLLRKIDLHVFPSRIEGFPKVTLETAAAGVPSLVYGDYGAKEWIVTGENGFVVDTLEEMKETIRTIKQNPEILQKISQKAIDMAKRYDWKVIIKDWEKEIEQLANGI
jgi:glycosyltransferase involved in cell wall biosynthesis